MDKNNQKSVKSEKSMQAKYHGGYMTVEPLCPEKEIVRRFRRERKNVQLECKIEVNKCAKDDFTNVAQEVAAKHDVQFDKLAIDMLYFQVIYENFSVICCK